MSLTKKETYSGAPNTERGRSASFDVSPDGKTIIYGCGTNIVIKDLANPLKVDLYKEHKAKVTCARFSPNGYYVCSADEHGNIIVWSFDNEDRTTQLKSRALSGAIRDIDWTFDSKRIAIVGEGKKTFAHVFIWNTGTQVGEIIGHSKMILSVHFRPSRPFKVVTGSEDFKSNFYTGPPFRFGLTNSNHQNYVNCVRYSPTSNEYVSVSSDKTMRIYEGKTGKEIGIFEKGHKGSIYQLSWSPKGDQLLTASADKTVRLWDLKSKKCTQTFTFQDKSIDYMQVGVNWCKKTGQAVTLSLNGNLNVLDFKNPKAPKTTAGHNAMINKIVFDGKKYFYSAGSGGQLIQWELGTANNKVVQGKKMSHNKVISTILCSGKFLVVGSDDSTVRYVPEDKFTYQAKSSDIKLKGVPCDLSKSKDGSTVFVATHNGVAVIDDANQTLSSYTGFNDFEPLSIAVNPTNGDVAIGCDDKLVRVYAVAKKQLSSKPKTVIKGHRGTIQTVRYSPDGKLLAVGDKFREIIVYDTSDYSPKYTELLFHSGAVTDLDWSSDSKYLVSCSLDKNVIVWDFANGKHISKTAHYQGVRSVVFLNGSSVLSAGAGYNLKKWEFKF